MHSINTHVEYIEWREFTWVKLLSKIKSTSSFKQLFGYIKNKSQEREEQLQRERAQEQEILNYYKNKMAAEEATQKLLIKPSLPLVEDDVIDVDKTSMTSFSLKVRPNGHNDHT